MVSVFQGQVSYQGQSTVRVFIPGKKHFSATLKVSILVYTMTLHLIGCYVDYVNL